MRIKVQQIPYLQDSLRLELENLMWSVTARHDKTFKIINRALWEPQINGWNCWANVGPYAGESDEGNNIRLKPSGIQWDETKGN